MMFKIMFYIDLCRPISFDKIAAQWLEGCCGFVSTKL